MFEENNNFTQSLGGVPGHIVIVILQFLDEWTDISVKS